MCLSWWQLDDFLDGAAVPMDGLTLTEALHRRGVNVRYLGTLLMELERAEEKGRLSHVQVAPADHQVAVFSLI